MSDRLPTTEAELRHHISSIPMTGSVEERRKAFERIMPPCPAMAEPGTLGGVSGLYVGQGRTLALWLHGGGYVFGSARTHAAVAQRMAALAECRIFLPDYRLAPEHPWPAMLQDACNVVQACSGPVILIGDSAGGHLTLNVAAKMPDRIERLVLFSPNTDRTGANGLRQTNSAQDIMNDDASDAALAGLAFQNNWDPQSPELSPRLHDGLFPPIFLACTRGEVLHDDARLLRDKIQRQGGDVSYREYGQLFHMFEHWPDILPDAQQALMDGANFMKTGGLPKG
ncbi:alpha/beta hydrolase [Parvularcula sp. LCG005]|uniref:alpha/beta hydrolase n=1 Tax=Parvularcula sp. LCG005 TaxID=3078805 RepID=UPI0029438C0D|nr:alpha/beta hydrolase [Parvularcula sp. LCG005]WOI54686.1 alpha/beta hydrolase [Parvularcula sp. LCG005]